MHKTKIVRGFSVGITTGLLVLLVVCTLFGDRIYHAITPSIEVSKSRQNLLDGERYIEVPVDAVTQDGILYYLSAEQGFSRTIYRLKKVTVENERISPNEGSILVKADIPSGGLVVKNPELVQNLQDEVQVIPEL